MGDQCAHAESSELSSEKVAGKAGMEISSALTTDHRVKAAFRT